MKERELFLLSIALVSDAQLNGAQKLFDDHWARAQLALIFPLKMEPFSSFLDR